MIPNRNRYLASLSAELRAQATRVRDLIGDRHWLSDGHHKEYLLKDILARHVPSSVAVSRGFVTHPHRADLVSREQDIMFVDTLAVGPIFDQGGVCVAFPQHVAAAIAVKTTYSARQLVDACETLNSLRRVAAYSGVTTAPWCGVLFFEGDGSAKDALCEKVGSTICDFADGSERVGEMSVVPDVIAILDTAGFVVDAVDPDGRIAVRGFDGDGTPVLLNGLLAQLARIRNANGAEFEAFASALDLPLLPGSPFERPPPPRR